MIIQLLIVLVAIIVGARMGGIGLGVMGGIGLMILTFVFGLQPTAPPMDVMLMIAAFFLWKNILPLAEGGIYLGRERVEDAVMLRGNIEEITELNANTHPKLSQPDDSYEESYGVRFTIDGVSCIGISKGELEVGDYVEAMYLPKSGYVLMIDKCDSQK